jgi:hypothetical protein
MILTTDFEIMYGLCRLGIHVNKKALWLLAGALLMSPMTFADNIIRMSAPIKDGAFTWQRISDKESSWKDVGAVSACSNWSPATSTIAIGQSFTQVATDCLQAHEKTVQGREQNVHTHEIRNVGAVRRISETYTTQDSRDSVGTNAGSWSSIASLVSGWANVGAPINCTNWSPSTDTVNVGTSFTQTATDCQQDQQQTVQTREQNNVTNEIRNVGSPQVNHKTLTVTSTRSAMGTFAGTWSAIASVTSAWTNVGVANCTNWSPAVNTMPAGVTFTQTATDCAQLQEQTIQAREQNSLTSEIRNVGSPQVNQKTLTLTQTRQATGTKTATADVYTMKAAYAGVNLRANTIQTISSVSGAQITSFEMNGNNGNIEIGTIPYYNPNTVTAFKWEMIDSNGVVQYTINQSSLYYTAGSYIGFKPVAADFNAAYFTYPNLTWRITITR